MIHSSRNAFTDSSPAFTLKEWEKTLHQAAAIVDQHGLAYLPLFQRAEAEVAKAKERHDILRRVRFVARDFDAQNTDRTGNN